MVYEKTELRETSAKNSNQSLRSKIIAVAVLLLIVALVSFVPQYSKVKRLTNELREARQDNSFAQIRDLAALVYFQANQKNYGLAAETSTRLFNVTREVVNQTPQSSSRKPLADLMALRDPITIGLAKGDSGVMNDVQALFVKTREATAISRAPLQSE
jgi:hypothetical protein